MEKKKPGGGIRFWLALWAAKLSVPVLKLTRHNGTNFPGSVAMKLCPDFLKYLAMPERIVAVTGTNGKTTATNFICDMLKNDGLRVVSNTAGSNMYAGAATALMEGVGIFNRCRSDVAVLEVDERSTRFVFAHVKPKYLAVTNIARDSIKRNAHQEYIFDLINRGISLTPDTTLILNADDPVSSFLGEDFGGGDAHAPNRRVYYGMAGQGQEAFVPGSPDFPVCPRCGTKPEFTLRHYRDIGTFRCPGCGLSSKPRDYVALKLNTAARRLTVEDKGGEVSDYPMLSDTVFNAYNTVMVIALFREMGYSRERIAELLGKIKITETRFTLERAGGLDLYTYAAKGQNGSAASAVFEYLAKEPSKKELVMLLDEHYGDDQRIETVTWLYESDFEYLVRDNIVRIIIAGHRYLDYALRLRLAGFPEDRLLCLEDENAIPEHVETEGIDAIYFLHDVYTVDKARRLRARVMEKLSGGGKNEG